MQSWSVGCAAVKLLHDARDRNGYRVAFVSLACATKDHVAVAFGGNAQAAMPRSRGR